MDLLKYSEQCSRLQFYKAKCKNLGPNTLNAISTPILAGLRNCMKQIEVMERTMVLDFNLKGEH